MRIRSIKPEFWRSEDVAALSWHDRLVFIGLWSYVDDNGVGRDDERIITAELFALEADLSEASLRVHGALMRLHAAGLITRYTVRGRSLIHIPTWTTHQKINRPTPGRFPLPTCDDAELSESSVSPHGALIEDSLPGAVEQGNRGTGEKKTPSPRKRDDSMDRFDDFWAAYPKRRDLAPARKAWVKAIAKATPDDIIAATKRYADERRGKDPEYTKYPATWLNKESWKDEPQPHLAVVNGHTPYRDTSDPAAFYGEL